MLSLRKRLPLLLGSSLALYGSLFAQIDLGWQKIERNDLPPSVEIYESTRNYPSGSLVYGVYALIDLTDPNLEWDVVNLGSTQTNKSPAQFAADSEETMYVVSNGSFFNTANGASITMLMDDANVLSYGPSNYGGTYQTHAMITRDALGRLAAVWGWPGETNSNKLMGFQNINTNTAQKPFVTVDEDGNTTESYPTNGVIGTFTEAMAGKPMLVKNGVANPPANWPLEGVATTGSFAERNPRTAVGVTADNKMIIMVIDGRQAEHSVGASLSEMSDIMLGAGAVEAVNLDGGGSSSMAVFDQTVTQPSDLEGARPVPNMMVIRRKAQIHDTEFAHYSETGAWISSGNSGNYGESKTRLAATVAPTEEPTAQGIYTLGENIVPARYEISGQWAGASNRSAAAPFSIRRAGFDDQRIAVSQTANTNTFNYIGTYDLAPGDQIVISNNASGSYVAADALRLRYVGESSITLNFANGNRSDLVHNSTIQIPVQVSSANSGVFVNTLRVYRSVDGAAEEQLGEAIQLNASVADSYTYTYLSAEEIGAEVALRFEVEDSRSNRYSSVYNLSIKPFAIVFNPERLQGEHRVGGQIAFDVNLDTQNPASPLSSMRVYVSIDGGEFELIDTLELEGSAEQVQFRYLTAQHAGSTVIIRFDVDTAEGGSASATYTANVVPAKGDITIGFVSDMNGSYGQTTYDSWVRNSFRFWADMGVDAVISGGDMIAGGSASLTQQQVLAMWTGFNSQLYSQLKNANIPFLFAMGNHDTAVAVDRTAAPIFWNDPANKPNVNYVDQSRYPYSWSAVFDFDEDGVNDVFFATIDSSDGVFSQAELDWLDATLGSAEAQSARVRLIGTHLSLYSVATERDDPGSLARPRQPLLDMMEQHDVQFFFFGHSAAYFPGQRYGRLFLSLGEMGGGGKAYVGEAQQAPSVITRADIFFDDAYYGQNAIVLTTYDIFDNFKVLPNSKVPTALFGYDGEFIMRSDIKRSDAGATTLSALNIAGETPETSGTASATVSIQGEEVIINGTFANLSGELLRDRTAISLYRGRNGQSANLLRTLHVESEDGKNGTFQARMPLSTEFRDGLALGLYGITVLTNAYPQGELRGQFFNDVQSAAPAAAKIVSQNAVNTYGVRDVLALYEISWEKAVDAEQGILTYTYQLARDANFTELLIDAKVGILTKYNALTEADWYAFLGAAEEGEVNTLYHRVIASDGQNVVVAPAQALRIAKDNTPPDGAIEIPAPGYKYEGVFAQTSPWHTYDIAIDEVNNRVWAVNYNGGINVYNADGSEYILPLAGYETGRDYAKSVPYKGSHLRMGTMYGVEWDKRGFMIVSAGGSIFKLDATTGECLAFNSGLGFGVNPVVDDNGRIFCHGVFTSTDAYILEENPEDPSTYIIHSRVPVRSGPAVVRTTSYSPEGNAIYLPDATASRRVNRVVSNDGGSTWVNMGDFEMNAPTGSNAVVAGPNHTVYLINNKSTQPPILIFRDFARNISWSQPLDGDLASDIRAFTISTDRKVIYVGDVSGRVFKFSLDGADTGPETPTELTLEQAARTNASGVATNDGVYARIEGLVSTHNFGSANSLDFFMQDTAAGVRIYQPVTELSYTPVRGDRIAVTGRLTQVAGQIRLGADAIEVISQGNDLPAALGTSELTDERESRLVTLHKLSLANPQQWSNSGYVGFTVEVVSGEKTYELFIHRGSPLFGQSAPEGTFHLSGVLTQLDPSSPYTEGYSVMPRNAADIAVPMQGYDDWAASALAGVPAELRSADADANGNGVSNLLEWIWSNADNANGNLFANVQVGQALERDADGERRLTLSFLRPNNADAGSTYSYLVQSATSLDGNSWNTLSAADYTLSEVVRGDVVEIRVTLKTPVSRMDERSYLRILWQGQAN